MRVLAAMSGGVDSAVAAARAADAGHDVTGVHLALSSNPQSFRSGAARLLHARGRPRRPPGGRRDRHPVLRVGPRRAVPRGRRRRLRRRVRRRAHPQPVPALQREDQVLRRARQGAGAGLRRGLHRPLRAASSTAGCCARSTRPRTSPTCSACSTPRQVAHAMFPLGVVAQDGRTSRGARARPRRRRQAGQPRHLLHRRRRHRRLPPLAGSATHPGAIVDTRRRRGRQPRRCLRVHGRAAQGAAHRPAGGGRPAALRARRLTGHQHGHGGHGRPARRVGAARRTAGVDRRRAHRADARARPGARARRAGARDRVDRGRRRGRRARRAAARGGARTGGRPLRGRRGARLGDHRLDLAGRGPQAPVSPGSPCRRCRSTSRRRPRCRRGRPGSTRTAPARR